MLKYSDDEDFYASSAEVRTPSPVMVPPASNQIPPARVPMLDLRAPFGDPLQKWQDSKQSLLVFGPSNYNRTKGEYEHDDTQSCSTVSGSGMDFFRKFVQRRGPNDKNDAAPPDDQGCKDCEDQFRREVLIDRLVTDALTSKAQRASSKNGTRQSSSRTTSESSTDSQRPTKTPLVDSAEALRRTLESSCSSGKCPAHQTPIVEDSPSIRSSRSTSTVSGTGLLFLRNYLKKKTKPDAANDNTLVDYHSEATTSSLSSHTMMFNSVAIPFPPKNDFYGPAIYIPDDVAFCPSEHESRRNSVGSTIADLLNDTFDSEDSELKKLDWDEWDEEEEQQASSYGGYDLEDTDIESDDASFVVDILDMAKPVITSELRPDSVSSVTSYQSGTTSCEPSSIDIQSIKEELSQQSKKKNKISIPFLDLPSPPLSSGPSSCSSTPTMGENSYRSLINTPLQQETTSPFSEDSNSSSRKGLRKNCSLSTFKKVMTEDLNSEEIRQKLGQQHMAEEVPPKKRLAHFWERRVSGSFDDSSSHLTPALPANKSIIHNTSTENMSKFRPALPSYYDPEGNKKANEKIQKFLEATRKAADENISTWSSNYEKLKRGELALPPME